MVGGLVALDGSRWDEDCNSCRCNNGRASCTKVKLRLDLDVCVCVCVYIIIFMQCESTMCKIIFRKRTLAEPLIRTAFVSVCVYC